MNEAFTGVLSALWEVWKEMASVFLALIPKIFSFVLWVLAGIIILPCVFIAGNLFPSWQEWGEKM